MIASLCYAKKNVLCNNHISSLLFSDYFWKIKNFHIFPWKFITLFFLTISLFFKPWHFAKIEYHGAFAKSYVSVNLCGSNTHLLPFIHFCMYSRTQLLSSSVINLLTYLLLAEPNESKEKHKKRLICMQCSNTTET